MYGMYSMYQRITATCGGNMLRRGTEFVTMADSAASAGRFEMLAKQRVWDSANKGERGSFRHLKKGEREVLG